MDTELKEIAPWVLNEKNWRNLHHYFLALCAV